jgi:hypothetical protein
MNIEKGKRALMVLAKAADADMNDRPPDERKADGMSKKFEGPKLDRGTQSRIGDQLRAMYTDLMDQPVPDRFKSLLDQLEKREQRKEGDGK